MTDAKGLLALAFIDIDAAKTLLPKEIQHSKVGHNLHQATEKILKAILTFHEVYFSKNGSDGHDLVGLMNKVSNLNVINLSDYSKLLDLDIYDSRSRYDFVDENNEVDLKPMIALCEKLMVAASKIIQIKT